MTQAAKGGQQDNAAVDIQQLAETLWRAADTLRFAFNPDELFVRIYKHAAADNGKIKGIDRFADALLAKCTRGHTISKHMVLFATEQKLLMMRPYQSYAVKNIVDCIEKNLDNGYVWHATCLLDAKTDLSLDA